MTLQAFKLNKQVFNSFASGCFWGFLRKNTETHMALRGNFTGLVCATDLVKSSTDAASLVACT